MSPTARALVRPTVLAAAVAAVYLIWAPPSTDLAAQTFRVELFEQQGFALWNNAWYGGHHTLGYSVVYPPFAALVGVRLAGAIAAVAAAALFAALARRRFGDAASLGALWFAFGVSAWLFTGRLTYLLGVAFALGALLAADRHRVALAAALAALCTLASPVAGLFLGIAGVAMALAGDRALGAALALPAGAAILALNLAFPTGGDQPYPFSTFVAIPIFAALALSLVPREQRVLRIGVVVYVLLALAVYVVPTPIGSNAARLGALFAGPVAALVLWRRPAVLAALALPLLYWQLVSPVEDLEKGLGDPATERAYYEPLLAELDRALPGQVARIEIPPTENRWEATYVAEKYPLARGWLRQLESDDFELFTEGNLTPAAYREWLDERGVSYVAIPDAELDYLAKDEVELVESGLEYLEPTWEGEHWRLYEVADARGLELDGARVSALGADWFELDAERAGSFEVRVHFSRNWRVVEGEGCIREAGGWTVVEVEQPGTVRVESKPLGDRCSE